MMTKLREKMAIIFVIVIIFFVLYIFLQWGMDVMSSSRNIANNRNYIGEVAGEKITRDYYNSVLTEMRNNYMLSKNKSSLSDEEERALQDQAFNKIVDDVIFGKLEKKYGYFTSQQEIQEIVMNVPPQSVRQDERFYKDGKFDMQMYQQLLSDPNNKKFVQDYYKQIAEELPRMKLQMDIISSVKIETDELLRELKLNETKFQIEYIVVPQKIDSSITVTDKEVREYYDNNKEQFRTQDKAVISFIYFPKEPSTQDVLMAKENIEGLRNDILKGNVTFENSAKLYSEDYGSAEKNGELGYIKKGQTVKEFEKAAFSLKKGEISHPVKTMYGWHIIRCEDKTRDSVKVSHILIRIKPSYETLQSQIDKIKSIQANIKEYGFEKAAEMDSLKIVTTQSFNPQVGYIFELGGYANRVCNFVNNSKVGDISDIIDEETGFIIARIDEKEKAGIPEFEKVKDLVKNRLILEKRRQYAGVQLSGIVKEIKNKNYSLKQYADMNKYNYNKTGLITSKDKMPYVSTTSRLFGAIFAAKENEIYFVSDDNYNYIFRVLKLQEVKVAENKNLIDKYHQMLINKRQQMLLENWSYSIRKDFEIKDYRY